MGKTEDIEGYKKFVFPSINKIVPMVICSDNHNINEYKTKTYTWIKADTTFKGLLQAINEPEDRIYIGDEPPVLKRVKDNSTKYINSLEVDAISDYNNEYGVWFKNKNIPINNELVAIIGNKGNGKSAIADILGLCGNSDIEEDDYKFLHKDKFKKGNISKKYQAKITWEDKSTQNFINLDNKISIGTIPKVKYLTQGYFERLCNEINKADNFRKELEKVVFQHINDSEKLGANNFEEFIDKKKTQINNEKELFFKELSDVNSKIIKLEEKLSDDYKRKIESEFETKKTELEAHKKNEPKKVEKPKENLTTEQEKQKKELESLKKELSELNGKIIETEETEKQLNTEIFELENLIKSIEIKEKEILTFKDNNREKLEKYGIDVNNIIKVNINITTIINAKNERQIKLEEIKKLLSIESENSLLIKKGKLSEKINLISNKLSEPEKLYQEYIKELEKWTNKKNEIEGKEEIYGTLKYYEKELKYIKKSIKDDIEKLKNERIEIVIKIFRKIKELQENYNKIKYSIDKVLSENTKELENYPIKIESTIKIKNGFVEKFLDYISLNVIGSFKGKEDGEIKIKEIISDKDFNEENEIKDFLNNIIYNLENDTRGTKSKNNNISKQIKNKKDFYSFLFSLDYIEPYYELMQNNKSIEQLSPGEKGALLLVFYLLLDKSDIPLIIDQPEDNLDNQSVSRILVPFIKKAKERRQIIMVTHNPNLAVVADAEQIIYVHIDKENKNTFSFVAGSIENEEINKKIVEVLEGTMPAFTNRKNKYHCI